jgi:hypothetical protein
MTNSVAASQRLALRHYLDQIAALASLSDNDFSSVDQAQLAPILVPFRAVYGPAGA